MWQEFIPRPEMSPPQVWIRDVAVVVLLQHQYRYQRNNPRFPHGACLRDVQRQDRSCKFDIHSRTFIT